MPLCENLGWIILAVALVMVWVSNAWCDQLQVLPSLAVGQEYNNNIFFDARDEEDDFVNTISAGLELSERTERLGAGLSALIERIAYAHNEQFDDVDQQYSGRLGYNLTPKLGLSTDAGYLRDSTPDRDIETTGIFFGTEVRKRWDWSVLGDYALSETTAISLSSTYGSEDFEQVQQNDSESYSVNLGLTHNLSGVLSSSVAQVDLGYSRYDFTGSDVANYQGTIGMSHSFNEKLSLAADVGGRYTRSEFEVLRLEPVGPSSFRVVPDVEETREWGGVYHVTLSYAGEFTNASLGVEQGLYPASGTGEVAVRDSVVFEASRRLTEKLSVNLFAAYFLNQSDEDEPRFRGIDEETFRIRPWLGYGFTKDLTLEATYAFTRLIDRKADTETDQSIVFLRLRYQYPLFD